MTRDLTGQTFGRLTVLGRGEHKGRHRLWSCRCTCGAEKDVLGFNLKSGITTSCGCYRREVCAERATARMTKHGDAAGGGMTSEYRAWVDMRARCEKPQCRAFPYYGARGIKVCERWSNFATFLDDMGRRPSPRHSLDRIDNDGDYTPENCRWATRDVQSHNKRGASNTGRLGIRWDAARGRYAWAVSRDGKTLRGRATTLTEASAAHAAARAQLYGAPA